MADHKLAFAQINMGHRKAACSEINSLTLDSNLFIILVQEPYLKKNLVSNLDPRRFTLINHIGTEKIRTCILASKNCNILPLRQFCKGDLTAAAVKFYIQGNEHRIVVASVYMPYDKLVLPPHHSLHRVDELL